MRFAILKEVLCMYASRLEIKDTSFSVIWLTDWIERLHINEGFAGMWDDYSLS